jgi:hypothetical protein
MGGYIENGPIPLQTPPPPELEELEEYERITNYKGVSFGNIIPATKFTQSVTDSPDGGYFFDKRIDKWKMTRASSPTLVSSQAVWFRTLFKKWYADEVEQAIYFSNCPDMVRYEQKIFDFPVCFLKTVPRLIKNTSEGIGEHRTCTSFVVHLQPKLNSSEATQRFIDIYEQFGRVIY